MSTMIMSQCWPLQGFTAPQKAVLISLADNANDEGVCWPAIGTIAMRTCLCERSVQRAIQDLKTLQILTSQKRHGRSTVYCIEPCTFLNAQDEQNSGDEHTQLERSKPVLKTIQKPIQGVTQSHPRRRVTPDSLSPHPRQRVTPPLTQSHPTPDSQSPRTVIEPSKNHQKNRHGYSDDFERFWQTYPKRAGGNPKQSAWRNWQRNLKQGIDPQQMIRASEWYQRYCDLHGKTLTEYVKQAATFLNDADAIEQPEDQFPLVQHLSETDLKRHQKSAIRERVQDIHDVSWAGPTQENNHD